MKCLSSLRLLLVMTWIIPLALHGQEMNPSFEEVLSLSSGWQPRISNDGKLVVYEVQQANWDQNYFDTELWIASAGKEPQNLTNDKEGSNYSPEFSPDNTKLLYFHTNSAGKSLKILDLKSLKTKDLVLPKGNIQNFIWSPNSREIFLLIAAHDKNEENRAAFYIEDSTIYNQSIWKIDLNHQDKARQLLQFDSKIVNNFQISPNGYEIAIEYQKDDRVISKYRTDISVIDLKTKEEKNIISNRGYDGLIDWSPDGREILYHTYLNDTLSDFYRNIKLYKHDLESGKNKRLAVDFDENIYDVVWNKEGIFGLVQLKTRKNLLQIDSENGKTNIIDKGIPYWSNFSFSENGEFLSFLAGDDETLPEVYRTKLRNDETEKITDFSNQINQWKLPQSEVISWKNSNGEIIDGVLRKPFNYNPNKEYSLLCILHGGPKATSWPEPVPTEIYPINQWSQEDVLILQPNYRGSAGYGEDFRAGLEGDFARVVEEDIISGLEFINENYRIKENKIGIMGWSFGGFITAYLSINTDYFSAASVGAGISDWTMNYYSTDEHSFTVQYLKATPWDNQSIYSENSPITNISKAHTPTLIQHGAEDRRVPIENAFALYKGLEDYRVPVKLIVFEGFGHRITKPKERLAALKQNWDWFKINILD